ncbi:hypothetical protein PLICRDRAFT_335183 [Plicaturopsis crispa FD-325 SS-3]|uniref:Uncharacterized protein n=1 Tax=Plicaturopsis crispa FD-325 SS-3 TaxID=944288 RepID=A0A0C9TA76_PLICR|nr:hypothetical protein PLICRDRAFT_335183 [Plicaturopsis crispa FD-325 SS-3]
MSAYDHRMAFPANDYYHYTNYSTPRHAPAPPVSPSSSSSSIAHALGPSRPYTPYPYPYPHPYATSSLSTPRPPRKHASTMHLSHAYTSPPPSPLVSTRARTHSQRAHARRPSLSDLPPHANSALRPLTRVPQPRFSETKGYYSGYAPTVPHLPRILFQKLTASAPGVSVREVISSRPERLAGPPVVQAADDYSRQITIRILWPGYSSDPLSVRIATDKGNVDRDLVLARVAKAIMKFTQDIKSRNVAVERGYENWAIGMRPDGSMGIDGPEIVITKLSHRLGANWQPEFLVPAR